MKTSTYTKTLFAFFAAFVLSLTAQAQTNQEKAEMVQQALSIPEMQAYYKLKDKPERKQLYILDNGKILNTLPVVMHGNKVIIAKRNSIPTDNYIEIQKADFKPALSVINYHYPAENIAVEVKLVKKGNKWTKQSASISPLKK